VTGTKKMAGKPDARKAGKAVISAGAANSTEVLDI
jgi:hypothetical protein